MTILFTRCGRTVLATSGCGVLPAAAAEAIAAAATFTERLSDFSGRAEGGCPYSWIDVPLYEKGPAGGLLFPLGLRVKVAAALRLAGFAVRDDAADHLRKTKADVLACDWEGALRTLTPQPDQVTCLARVLASDGGIITSTTGSGKSFLARFLARLHHKARVHIVTKSANLVDEIASDLRKIIPDVGTVTGRGKNLRRVTVFTADSIPYGRGEADLLLADEIHELAAPRYTALLAAYTDAVMFGFTATFGKRTDGRDAMLEAIFGPVIYELSYQEAEALGRVVPITVEWLRPSVLVDPTAGERRPTERERLGIWENAARNRAIAERVNRFEPDDQVLVMVKTIDHAVRLKALCPGFTLCYAANGMDRERLGAYIRSGLLPPDEPILTPALLNQRRVDFASGRLRKVIANYVWSTGVNFLTLAALVRADAADSGIKAWQIPGRICRRVADVKESALLVDCWDDWSDNFLRRSRNRRRNYAEQGWKQIDPPPRKRA